MSLRGVTLNKVMIFLQARMGSTRLPGKTLMKIADNSLIGHCLARLNLVGGVGRDGIVLLTSTEAIDDQLVEWCEANGINVFRGSEQNVLERYYQAMKVYGPDYLIRATGDNPFVDPFYATDLIDFHIKNNYDYSSSKSEFGTPLPDGIGLEIFSSHCLQKVFEKSHSPHHFEHVNEFVLENPEDFKVGVLPINDLDSDFSKVRLTVDTPEDFEKAKAIISSPKYSYNLKLPDLLKLI